MTTPTRPAARRPAAAPPAAAEQPDADRPAAAPRHAEPGPGTDEGTRATARGGALNLAGTVVAGLAGLGVTWLVARAAGPGAAGAFFTATAAFALLGTVARLGAPTSLVYWPARLRARGQTHLLGACLRTGLAPVAAAGLVVAAALWWTAPVVAGWLGGGTAELRTLAVLLPPAVVADALLAATRGYRAMGPTVLLDRVARPAAQLLGIAALAVAGRWVAVPLWLYALAFAAPYAPVAGLAAVRLRRLHRAAPTDAAPTAAPSTAAAERRRLRGQFWRFAGPRAAASVAQSALQRVDVLLVAGLAGLAAAAVYAVAGRFVLLGQAVNQAISQAVQPRLAEALATGDRAAARALYQTATGWLVLVTWPLHLTVLAFAPRYLDLFGPQYRSGAAAAAVLAAAMLVATGCGMVDTVLAMGGRTSWNLYNVALALAVMIGLDLLLIPRYGALGAALGLAAAVLVNNLLPLAQVGLALRVHPFGPGMLAAAAAATACYGVLPLLVTGVAGRGLGGLAVSLAVSGAAYLACAAALRRPLALAAFRALRKPTPPAAGTPHTKEHRGAH
ncbi:MAG TPA: polysaccharide biosynthesis C-terminal domain-containing protein [Pilimelia sp.]|nr:polysaccharide biosynthesis C-terminal domain-containing protein [Pilimelia sp.]